MEEWERLFNHLEENDLSDGEKIDLAIKTATIVSLQWVIDYLKEHEEELDPEYVKGIRDQLVVNCAKLFKFADSPGFSLDHHREQIGDYIYRDPNFKKDTSLFDCFRVYKD